MGKVKTTEHTVQSTDGTDIVLNIPAGPMDPPCEYGEHVFKLIKNKDNWKLPTANYHTDSKEHADKVVYVLDWYLGGHEIIECVNDIGTKSWVVSSKGYYHYVGA